MMRDNDAIVTWGQQLATLMEGGAARSPLFEEGARNLVDLLRDFDRSDAEEAADRIEATL